MNGPDATPTDSRRVVLLSSVVLRLAELIVNESEATDAVFLASEVLAGLQDEPVLSWPAEYLHADDLTSSLGYNDHLPIPCGIAHPGISHTEHLLAKSERSGSVDL